MELISSNTSNNSCAILVHIFERKFNYIEEESIKNLFEKLGNDYDIYAIHPKTLDLLYYKKTFDFTNYLPTNDLYFTYPFGYNYLMTSKLIYKTFESYKYVLIHHPDAWIFNNDLDYWIKKDYDIIGAPIICGALDNLFNGQQIYYRIQKRMGHCVIQGGFNMRKVDWMLKNIEDHPYSHIEQEILYWMTDKRDCSILVNGYEDVFISSHYDSDNWPKISECNKFCVDIYNVKRNYIYNDYYLPMGIHGLVSRANKTIISEDSFIFLKNLGAFKNISYENLKL